MTNPKFLTIMLSVPVVAGLLIGGCSAAHAAERGSLNTGAAVRGPGGCVVTERLVTRANGMQHIVRKTVCERTQRGAR